MNPTYDHNLVGSFITWFDFVLNYRGQAYVNTPALFYPIKSDLFPGHVYAAPFKPLMYDIGLSGVAVPPSIPTGFLDANNNLITRASGISLNFQQGQIISQIPLAAPLSANIAYKEFDIIYTNEEEHVFIEQTRFCLRSKITNQIPTTGMNERTQTIPLIAIKYNPGNNVPFAFGGLKNTLSEFRCIIISDDVFKLDAVLSLFRDTAESNFTFFSANQLPFNSWGDYKGGVPFNYLQMINQDPSNYVFIHKVDAMKLSEAAGNNIGQKVYVGILDFNVEKPRYLNNVYPF